MLSKEEIIKLLNDDNNFVDSFILDAFIKNWKIEAIYEDENGIEFYDEAAFQKIKAALVNKPEEKEDKNIPDIDIIEHEEIKPELIKTVEIPEPIESVESAESIALMEPVTADVVELQSKPETPDTKNFTLDITNQTLSLLAKSIADKITGDISGYLKKNDWLEEAFNAGAFKKDNELLASKLNELLSDNKILIKRIQELEKENNSFVNVFANIYVKKLK